MTVRTRRAVIAGAVVAGVLLVAGVVKAQVQPPPNMIFIMADDQAWPFCGFMREIHARIDAAASDPNDPLHALPHQTQHPSFPLPPVFITPNLDRLATRGVVFPVGHSGGSVCRPSLRSVLNGVYMKDFQRHRPYIPHYLTQVGYNSFGFGKLWQAHAQAGFTCLTAADCGGRVSKRSKWLARRTITPLLQFIHDGPRPWLAWYSPAVPHVPANAAALIDARDGENPLVGVKLPPPELAPDAGQKLHDVRVRMGLLELFLDNEQLQLQCPYLKKAGWVKYLQNVFLLDYWVGLLLDSLELDPSLDTNTMIIFMSDNGYRMRKSKKSIGENGFRTPILISLPRAIPPGQPLEDRVLPQMAHAVDLLPTMLDYATNAPAPQCAPGQVPIAPAWNGSAWAGGCLEGGSLRPVIEGVPGAPARVSFRHAAADAPLPAHQGGDAAGYFRGAAPAAAV